MSEAFKLAPHEWALLRSLLDEALALPAARRGAWLAALDEARAQGLKPRLKSLLANAADDDPATAARLLLTLPKVETGQFAPLPGSSAEKAGDAIGPYRLIRELGSGGMGSVWLAERTDMLQGRHVALKLPHGAWKRAGLAERMAREREILATLDHPHIARLYDAGVVQDGQPYLALEFVQGERIDEYCRRLALTVRQRVQLALQVVRAVAHAHGRLVVHRDLKPSNILVTNAAGAGEVKLLDFGIAKLVEQGAVPATELTQAAGHVFTPEYASPEQVRGEPLSTASDIYSLGVVLFELLADERPYRLGSHAGRSRAALEEAIQRGALPRPSTVAPPDRGRALRGDLDTIVLKALEREPARRYATADALAEDLQRHLEQRPVLAQPDSTLYRAARFVARNRLAVGVAAGVGAAVLSAAGVAMWQASLARAEQQRAAQALAFITSIFREADPNVGPGQRPSAADLLRRARDRVDVQFAGQPRMRVELLNTLAESLVGVQDNDAADETAKAALREAEARYGPRDLQALRARLTRVKAIGARYDLAAEREELQALLPLLGPDASRHPDLWLRAQVFWAENHNGTRKLGEAEAIARAALAEADRLGLPLHEQRSALWQAIAESLEYRAQYGPALQAGERAVQHAEAAWPGRLRHPQWLNARYRHGRVLGMANRHDEAIAMLEGAAADAREHWGAGSRTHGQYLQALGVTQARAGQLLAAESSARAALAVLEASYGADAPHVAAAVDGLAFVHYQSRRADSGIALYNRALAITRKAMGPNAEPTFPQRMRRGALLAWQGRLDAALPELRSIVEEYGRVGVGSLAGPLWHLGLAERLAGRPEVAVELQARALAAVREGPPAERERIAPRLERGAALVALARFDEAERELAAALGQADALRLARTPMRCDGELALGRARLALGRAAEAAQTLRPCDEYWQRFDAASPWAGEAAYWHARALEATGQAEAARAAMVRALPALRRSPQPTHALLVKTAAN